MSRNGNTPVYDLCGDVVNRAVSIDRIGGRGVTFGEAGSADDRNRSDRPPPSLGCGSRTPLIRGGRRWRAVPAGRKALELPRSSKGGRLRLSAPAQKFNEPGGDLDEAVKKVGGRPGSFARSPPRPRGLGRRLPVERSTLFEPPRSRSSTVDMRTIEHERHARQGEAGGQAARSRSRRAGAAAAV